MKIDLFMTLYWHVRKKKPRIMFSNGITFIESRKDGVFIFVPEEKKWSAENNNSKKIDKTTFLSVSVCCSVIDSVWLCGLPQYIFNATTHSSNPTISPKRNEYSICLFSWWSNSSMKGINKYGIDILLKKYQTTCLLFDCCCFVDSWMYIHTFYGER